MSVAWPVVPGTYKVGDPRGPVAVCALNSEKLISPLVSVAGVAIAGIVYTANLGITRIITNITANPTIRFLLVCGRDSPIFKPGQSLVALAENGIDGEKRIVGAAGYDPVLGTLPPEKIQQFRKQVEVLDWSGEEDVDVLSEGVRALFARNPGAYKTENYFDTAPVLDSEKFLSIRPGGQREPLMYDPKGYFVITLDREKEEIVLRHYLPDHRPVHEMRGRGASSMVLGLLREGLVTQLSHAGYLGEELAKAQTALQFGFRYDQDRPLRQAESAIGPLVEESVKRALEVSPSPEKPPAKMPAIQPAMTLKEFDATTHDSKVNIAIRVTGLPRPNLITGTLIEPDEAEPFNLFHLTQRRVDAEWDPKIRIIMGTAAEVMPEALLRVVGTVDKDQIVHAEELVILTKYARIS